MSIAGEIILKSLGAWVAIWGFSRLLNAPKKLECYTAGVGMIGWAVYVPHRLLDRYGTRKHGWNVSFRDSDRGRRNCSWNFPRRSAAEDIFLRSPQVIYEKSEKFAKTKFFAFFCRIL